MSCSSCAAPLVLTYTLALRSDQPREDSLELYMYPFPRFRGDDRLFDKRNRYLLLWKRKQIVSSNSNNILTRQTCVQYSSWVRDAKSERFHFIFPYEFAICSEYRNVEDCQI